jgi:hypothetical protein
MFGLNAPIPLRVGKLLPEREFFEQNFLRS